MQYTDELNKEEIQKQRGMTLTEILVVVVIIGIIGTVVTMNVLPMVDKARVETARNQISILDTALQSYKLDQGQYPTNEQGLRALVEAPNNLRRPERYREGGYLPKLPIDPWGNEYLYVLPGTDGPFDVFSLGADGKDGGNGVDADIGNWE